MILLLQYEILSNEVQLFRYAIANLYSDRLSFIMRVVFFASTSNFSCMIMPFFVYIFFLPVGREGHFPS